MGNPTGPITIVGMGGIGCALGYALRAGDVDVTFVEADETKIDWGQSNGIGVDEHPMLPARIVSFADWEPSPDGITLLCAKCYDNEIILSRLPNSACVIPVQNGFDPKLIERTQVEGIASFVSECVPGKTHTRITRPGDLHMGPCLGGGEADMKGPVDALIQVLERHGDYQVRRVPDVLPYKYTKLMYNAAISPLAASAGLDNGQLLTHARARKLFFAMLRENYLILKGAGVPLGRIGPFHPDTVQRILKTSLLARALAWPFSLTLRGTYCSMAGDLPGRSEVDNYNGHLIELARGQNCPLNRAVHELVKRLEQECGQPELRWLDDLLLVGAGP